MPNQNPTLNEIESALKNGALGEGKSVDYSICKESNDECEFIDIVLLKWSGQTKSSQVQAFCGNPWSKFPHVEIMEFPKPNMPSVIDHYLIMYKHCVPFFTRIQYEFYFLLSSLLFLLFCTHYIWYPYIDELNGLANNLHVYVKEKMEKIFI